MKSTSFGKSSIVCHLMRSVLLSDKEVLEQDLTPERKKNPEPKLLEFRNTALKWCTAGIRMGHWRPRSILLYYFNRRKYKRSRLPLHSTEFHPERKSSKEAGSGKTGIVGYTKSLNVH